MQDRTPILLRFLVTLPSVEARGGGGSGEDANCVQDGKDALALAVELSFLVAVAAGVRIMNADCALGG